MLVLSLFPGVDLLGRAFEAEGFCLVRGPDPLWGGDVRRFHPPPGVFYGVIAGSPCQDFSAARRSAPTGIGRRMLVEFSRVVWEARAEWWLLENVPRCPDVPGLEVYTRQRFEIDQAWFSGTRRRRHVQFGSFSGRLLDPPRGRPVKGAKAPALACDDRSFRELCRLQGLPDDFDLPGFLEAEKKRAVGNGVPLVMGRVLARAVLAAYGRQPAGPAPEFDVSAVQRRRCRCGCGRVVGGRAFYAGPACRKRAERARRRDATSAQGVTELDGQA